MKKKILLTGKYRCTSSGPQNNGLLKKCSFEQEFEHGLSYNCPICASRLEFRSEGKTISDLLREGWEYERSL